MANRGGEIVDRQNGQPGLGGTAAGARAFLGHGAPDGGAQADPHEALVQRLQAARARIISGVEHHRLKRDLIQHASALRPDV